MTTSETKLFLYKFPRFWAAFPRIEFDILVKPKLKYWQLLVIVFSAAYVGVGVCQYWKLEKRSGEISVAKAKFNMKDQPPKQDLAEFSKAEKASLIEAHTKLNYTWDRPFKAIEKSRMEEVFVLEVQPNINKLELKITAQTNSLKTMLDYTKKLREQPFVRRVILDNKEKQNNPAQPIRFGITLAWY